MTFFKLNRIRRNANKSEVLIFRGASIERLNEILKDHREHHDNSVQTPPKRQDLHTSERNGISSAQVQH